MLRRVLEKWYLNRTVGFSIRRPYHPEHPLTEDEGTVVFHRYDWFSIFGWHFGINWFVGSDTPDFFHTHPSTSLRIVLVGGYVEEMLNEERRTLKPGHIGILPWHCAHRVDKLLDGDSWSFFIYKPTAHRFRAFYRIPGQ